MVINGCCTLSLIVSTLGTNWGEAGVQRERKGTLESYKDKYNHKTLYTCMKLSNEEGL